MTDTESKADIRVVDNAALKRLNFKARRLSRSIDDRWMDGYLDPEGFSTVFIVLYGHNMDKPNSLLHHRCMVHAKVKGSDEPETLIMDIADEDWKLLPNAYKVLDRAKEKIAAGEA